MSPVLPIPLPVKFTLCGPKTSSSEDTQRARGKHRLPFKLFAFLF